MKLELTVNGFKKVWEIEPRDYLLDVLRLHGYTSVKKGCDTSSCGVCTVLMDEVPVLSCSLLAAKAQGSHITTVEGVQLEAEKFGSFLVGEGADQCGFCSTGLVLTIMAMKKEFRALCNTTPTDAEINHYLAGNLCRCSGYVGQLRAIRQYLEVE